MIEKIIENEWKNKDKNYFLSKLYEWIWNYLNRINQMCAYQSEFYINNNAPYKMQILNDVNSEILYLSSIGKYCDLFSFLKNDRNYLFGNDQNYNNIKIQKIIYIFNNIQIKISLMDSIYGHVIENHNIFACQLINFDNNYLKLNKNIFSVLQKVALYFGYELKYDEKSGIELIETNLDILLSTLNSEDTTKISEFIKKCLMTEQLVDKLSYMSQIAIKMSKYLSKNNNIYKDYFINNNIFIDKYYNCLSRENNGYFRHDLEDSGDKEKTKEWNEFDDNTKIKIINEKIIIYSFILAIIENINKELNN